MLDSVTWWMWALVVIVTVYHAIRGAHCHWVLDSEKAFWRRPVERVAYGCVQWGFFWGICSASGFAALGIALWIVRRSAAGFTGGDAAALVFLGLVAILGIGGELPHVLMSARFPMWGSSD